MREHPHMCTGAARLVGRRRVGQRVFLCPSVSVKGGLR